MRRTRRRRCHVLSLSCLALALVGCSSTKSPLPLRAGPPPAALSSRVLAGHARAFRFAKGEWAAAPAYDYDFVVLERRYADRREAVKEIHRRDPGYDGLAGPRDQTFAFTVRVRPAAGGGSELDVESTLGRGSGHEDPEGATTFEMAAAERGLFVPYDTIRITQRPPDPAGRLLETVELFSKKRGSEVPFLRIEEEAVVFRPAGTD